MTKYEIKKDFIEKMEKCQRYRSSLNIQPGDRYAKLHEEIFGIAINSFMANYKNEMQYIMEFLQDGFCVRIGRYEAVETLEDFAIIISEAYSK